MCQYPTQQREVLAEMSTTLMRITRTKRNKKSPRANTWATLHLLLFLMFLLMWHFRTVWNGLNSVVLHIGVDSLHGPRHQQLTFRTNVGPPHHSLAVLICALSSMMYPISKKLFEGAQRTSSYFTYHIYIYIRIYIYIYPRYSYPGIPHRDRLMTNDHNNHHQSLIMVGCRI